MLVGYVRVTLFEAVFDSVTIGIAVALFGVPVAFALSALVFLSVFIPILGAILSGLLIVLVALVTKGFGTALALAIIILVVQQFDANVLYPVPHVAPPLDPPVVVVVAGRHRRAGRRDLRRVHRRAVRRDGDRCPPCLHGDGPRAVGRDPPGPTLIDGSTVPAWAIHSTTTHRGRAMPAAWSTRSDQVSGRRPRSSRRRSPRSNDPSSTRSASSTATPPIATAARADTSLPFGGVPARASRSSTRSRDGPTPRRASCSRTGSPPTPAPTSTGLRAAGTVPVGLTTASEFGGVNLTRTVIHGATHNPWMQGRTPGGSSGGTAAAVAGGLVTARHRRRRRRIAADPGRLLRPRRAEDHLRPHPPRSPLRGRGAHRHHRRADPLGPRHGALVGRRQRCGPPRPAFAPPRRRMGGGARQPPRRAARHAGRGRRRLRRRGR